MARGRRIHPLNKRPEDAAALVELSVAFLADELGERGVLAHRHPDQPLEVREEDLIHTALLLRVLPHHRDLPKGVAQAPGGELPVAEATVSSAQGSANACERRTGCSRTVPAAGARSQLQPEGTGTLEDNIPIPRSKPRLPSKSWLQQQHRTTRRSETSVTQSRAGTPHHHPQTYDAPCPAPLCSCSRPDSDVLKALTHPCFHQHCPPALVLLFPLRCLSPKHYQPAATALSEPEPPQIPACPVHRSYHPNGPTAIHRAPRRSCITRDGAATAPEHRTMPQLCSKGTDRVLPPWRLLRGDSQLHIAR